MADSTGALTLIKDFMEVVTKFSARRLERRSNVYKAVTAIRLASIETKAFIEEKGYQPNLVLVRLWHDALNKCAEAGLRGELPEYLYSKAEFWGQPSEWLENHITLELVPKLDYLKKACDDLLVELNSK